MKVVVLREAGYGEALLGLSLSYNRPIERMSEVAVRLCDKDGGHNKFLESIVVWLDITGPRSWWVQFDTYRVGMTKQSESTMHTVMQRPLQQDDFEQPIHPDTLGWLNFLIRQKRFDRLKLELPEGYLQRRIVCTNYKTLRRIYNQRWNHRLPQWQVFCTAICAQLEYADFLRTAEQETDDSPNSE